MPGRTLKIASCRFHFWSTKEQSVTFLLFVFSWHLVTLIRNWAKQLKNEYTRTVRLWRAYTFQEEKGNFCCCCEGNFLHTFCFVMDTLVPQKTAIMKLCCLQTFVPLTEQASFVLASSTVFSSLERPPLFHQLFASAEERTVAGQSLQGGLRYHADPLSPQMAMGMPVVPWEWCVRALSSPRLWKCNELQISLRSLSQPEINQQVQSY